MKRLLLLLVLASISSVLFAQGVLRGRVIASDTRKPVGNANVYLSNTSIGTVSAENGSFEISSFPTGRFELVVSFIGYETYTLPVLSSQLPSQLEVVLKPRIEELQEVVLLPFEKNGWEKWGNFFLQTFVGTSANAKDCELLNKEVVKFRHNKKTNVLQAFAGETLLFENKALGYKIRYDLTRFEYDFGQRMFFYQGYPFFEEMTTSRGGLRRRWERRREDAYYGSLMHFMRSLYRNRLQENHFEVRRLIKISDAEKKRVREVYRAAMQQTVLQNHGTLRNVWESFPPDSASYYRTVMQEPDKLNVLIDRVLPGDSIAFAIDSVTAGLEFTNHLQVVYPLKNMPQEYKQDNHMMNLTGNIPLTSEITLTTDAPISILYNGAYYEGLGLLTSGYWGWWEKVGNMLPYHYQPPPVKAQH